MVCDKERWCVCVTKLCVKDGVCESCVWKRACDKVVCERWCVTKWCVKDGVVKDGVWQSCVWKMMGDKVVCDNCVFERWCGERWCWQSGVWRMVCDKVVCERWCVTASMAGSQARHQSQPSAISATPRKVTIHVAKCHTCHAKWRSMSLSATPPPEPAQCHKCHACRAKWRSMSPSGTPATQSEGRRRQVPRLPRVN